MSQLTLDGRDTRVKVTPMRHYGHGWWQSACAYCGGWLSKYDFTEQDAHDLGVLELERHHACRLPVNEEAT